MPENTPASTSRAKKSIFDLEVESDPVSMLDAPYVWNEENIRIHKNFTMKRTTPVKLPVPVPGPVSELE